MCHRKVQAYLISTEIPFCWFLYWYTLESGLFRGREAKLGGEVIIVFLLIRIYFPFWKWISSIVVYKAFKRFSENRRNKSLVYVFAREKKRTHFISFFFLWADVCVGVIILKHQNNKFSMSSELLITLNTSDVLCIYKELSKHTLIRVAILFYILRLFLKRKSF